MSEFLPFARSDVDEDTIARVVEVLRSGWITTGPQVALFEQELSRYFNDRAVVALSSGSISLEIALRCANVQPGDVVLTTPLTWVSTVSAILAVHAKPVFVDIDERTRLMDLDHLVYVCDDWMKRATVRAVVPVDLAGCPVDRTRLYEIAQRFELRVIEDAAQSLGASWGQKPIGAQGDLVSFSFQANKNITTAEGGCLVLPADVDPAWVKRHRALGVMRHIDGYDLDELGVKANMTDIAAALGRGQFARLAQITAKRQQLAKYYLQRLAEEELPLECPPADFVATNWHLFQIVLKKDQLRVSRAQIRSYLEDHQIGTGIHYPLIYTLRCFASLLVEPCVRAEKVGAAILSLPLFFSMTECDVDRVINTLGPFLLANRL